MGLGSVPAWLKSYPAISNGEKFRAGLARLLLTGPDRVVLDEFTSVVNRQIAKVGAAAFARAWRGKPGHRVVLLTPHYDILDWVEADRIINTRDGRYGRGRLRRPNIELEIRRVDGRLKEIA